MTERFTPNAASHALVIENNNLLMLRRLNTGWTDGMYTTPAGHIEKGESAAEAAARELFEESGIHAKPEDMEHAITVHRQNESKGVYFDNYFIAKTWAGEPYVAEPDKSDRIEWIALNNLPDNIVPTVSRAIKAYLAGKHYVEDGWD